MASFSLFGVLYVYLLAFPLDAKKQMQNIKRVKKMLKQRELHELLYTELHELLYTQTL